MATPAQRAPITMSTLLGFAAGNGGPQLMPAPTSVQTLPTAAPTVHSNASATISLLGVDVATFSLVVQAAGSASSVPTSQTVTFANLPYRYNNPNPTAPTTVSQQPYAVGPTSILIFVAFVQGLTTPAGAVISAASQALTTASVAMPGPFLGAGSYQTFQAVVSALGSASGAVSGSVVGLLFLSNG